jgi:hypothetical protein
MNRLLGFATAVAIVLLCGSLSPQANALHASVTLAASTSSSSSAPEMGVALEDDEDLPRRALRTTLDEGVPAAEPLTLLPGKLQPAAFTRPAMSDARGPVATRAPPRAA